MAVKNFFSQDGLNVNNYFIANTTVLAVGSNLTVNATTLYVNAIGVWANSSLGTNGQYLASNGTSTYWATVAAGVNTAAQYTWTNTHTFNANVTFGTSAGLIANSSIGTNGQYLASNGTTIYWATPTASAAAGGPNTAIQFANGTSIAGNGEFTFDYTTGIVQLGTGGFAFGTATRFEGHASQNNYIEWNLQNANTGNNASTDFTLTADSGNDVIDYINIGINGSNYNQAAYSIGTAKDGYVLVSNGNLTLGVLGAKEVRIHAGGATTNNEIVSVNATSFQINPGIQVYSPPIMSTIMTALGYAWF